MYKCTGKYRLCKKILWVIVLKNQSVSAFVFGFRLIHVIHRFIPLQDGKSGVRKKKGKSKQNTLIFFNINP